MSNDRHIQYRPATFSSNPGFQEQLSENVR
jgi:hypothetical protein